MSVIIARIAQRRLYPIVAGVDIPAISVSVTNAVPGRKRRLCMADTAVRPTSGPLMAEALTRDYMRELAGSVRE